MGLLDFKMPGLDTAEGQGLLAMGLSLMGAQKYPGQKGALAGAFSDAGRQYMGTVSDAKNQAQRRSFADMQMKAQQLQLEDAQRQRAEQERAAAAIRQQFGPGGTYDPRTLLDAGGVGALEQGLKINSALNPKPQFTAHKPGDVVFRDGDYSKPVFSVPDKPAALPSAIQEYQFAQGQGYKGTFQQWDTARKAAGATRVNVSNTSTQESEQSKAYGKGLGDMRVAMQKTAFEAPQKMMQIDRMEQLLKGVDGGKLAPAGMEVASFAKSLGLNIDPKLGNKEAAEALAVEWALSMKPEGSGSMSDRDYNNFMKTVPGLSKTAAGRAQIMSTMRAKVKRDIEIAKMARAYAKENGGVIDDSFLDIASEYVSKNPIAPAPSVTQPANVDALVDKYRSK